MQKITPYLWFDDQAEEAANLYTSCFANGSIKDISRYPEGPLEGPMADMAGKVMTASFEIAGLTFVGLNGGPVFNFTPAISFFVTCESKEELIALWEQLFVDGEVLMPLQAYPFSELYGWLNDQYGVSWQLTLGEGPQQITPMLMFVGEQCGHAEAAMQMYTALFDGSSIGFVQKDESGRIQHGQFKLYDQDFMAMDSDAEHQFTFTEATSFHVTCEDQDEVDRLWEALSAVPEAEQCGWLKDKFGVSWQIIPSVMPELLSDPDPEKAGRVMQAMLQMKKIDIAGLKAAYAGISHQTNGYMN